LSAAAVALAVAAVSVTCWFLVRGKLYDEVDSQLKDQAGRVHLSWVQAVAGPCPSEPPAQDSSQRPPSAPMYLQIVSVDYDHPCVADGSTGVVRVTDAGVEEDQPLAVSHEVGEDRLHPWLRGARLRRRPDEVPEIQPPHRHVPHRVPHAVILTARRPPPEPVCRQQTPG
ncbi:hypothetical protein ADL27_25255, partial [Streptomyces sp. NRRL F-6602]